MIVYSITNKLNNKKYFCLTGESSLKVARWNHRQKAKCIMRKMKLKPTSRKGRSPFHKAYARYGETNFRYRVEDRFSSRDDAFACKERLIAEYNTMNPDYGYNCTTGGNKSFDHAPHVKERLSVAHTGKIMPDSFVKIMKERVGKLHPSFGIKHSKEIREKMRRGQLSSDYVPSEETNKKTSETMKKRWQEPEIIAKMAKRKLRDISGKNNPMYGVSRKGKDNPMYGKRAWNRGVPTPQWQKDRISKANKEHARKRKEKLLKEISGRTEKECYKCNQIKKLDFFYKSHTNIDGYAGMCKSCEKIRKQKRRKNG
jgi:hypothetical protein